LNLSGRFDAGIFIFIIDFFDFDAECPAAEPARWRRCDRCDRRQFEILIEVDQIVQPGVAVGMTKHEAPWFWAMAAAPLITPFKPPQSPPEVMMPIRS